MSHNLSQQRVGRIAQNSTHNQPSLSPHSFTATKLREKGVRVRCDVRKRPCLMCGKFAHGCVYYVDATGSPYLSVCLYVASDRPAPGGLGGWMHLLRDSTPNPRPRPMPRRDYPPPHVTPRASESHVDEVFTAFLHTHLRLSTPHLESLLARGLTLEAIESHAYRTCPSNDECDRIADALAPLGLAGVPGFFFKGGRWRLRWMPPAGFIVPYRDERMRIQGLQIRRMPLPDGEKNKYIWLSSGDAEKFPQGASSGTPVHFRAAHLLAEQGGELLLTEGGLKCDVINFFTGQPCVAVAGVSVFNDEFGARLKQRLPELKRVAIAYDADYAVNVHVRHGLQKLMRSLSAAGLRYRMLSWSPEYKGFDDLLLAQSREGVAA